MLRLGAKGVIALMSMKSCLIFSRLGIVVNFVVDVVASWKASASCLVRGRTPGGDRLTFIYRTTNSLWYPTWHRSMISTKVRGGGGLGPRPLYLSLVPIGVGSRIVCRHGPNI
eukprot:SAG31_NODE_7525_length_1665_cov_6.600894_2_plen_113_part_00